MFNKITLVFGVFLVASSWGQPLEEKQDNQLVHEVQPQEVQPQEVRPQNIRPHEVIPQSDVPKIEIPQADIPKNIPVMPAPPDLSVVPLSEVPANDRSDVDLDTANTFWGGYGYGRGYGGYYGRPIYGYGGYGGYGGGWRRGYGGYGGYGRGFGGGWGWGGSRYYW